MSERKSLMTRNPRAGRPGATREPPLRLLVVDDELMVRNALKRMLSARGIEILTAEGDVEALDLVRRNPVDLVLTDVFLGGEVNGLQLLEALRRERPKLDAIVMSGHDQVNQDDALRAGALEFIRKDFANTGSFLQLLDSALHRRRAEPRSDALPPPPRSLDETLVGESSAMVSLREQVARIARRDVTALVMGETGTGKELIARALHENSPRRAMPFVAVNCGAIPEGVIDSELFGHARGAFTGAHTEREGAFRLAHGGTLFLDEVGELPHSAQVRLLRVLQEREVMPVGGREPVPVDIRLVAATHRDLRALVRAEKFREDLYFRLNVMTLRSPTLRERADDLGALVPHLLARLAAKHGMRAPGVADEAMTRLRAHGWPGNVRELENVLERALVLAEDRDAVETAHLPEELQDAVVEVSDRAHFDAGLLTLSYADARERVMDRFQRFYCEGRLRAAEGNVSRAAQDAGVDRANFRRMLRRFRD
ncbi:MAG: sigma-54 dependent transcriptional regulator [Polyangiales bacterium]